MNAAAPPVALFRLGNIVTEPSAKGKLTFDDIATGIRRHQAGDWGDVADAERAENDLAVQYGLALRSTYMSAKGVKFSLVTVADRSATTVTLADNVGYRNRAVLPIAVAPSPITANSDVSEQKRTTGKTVRSLQIEEIGDRWKGFKPRIRIMGQWLERAGFRPGTRVSVICRESGIIELRTIGAFQARGNLVLNDEIQNPS